jgi:3-methyladenine DNA glycosylase Tag
LRDKYGSLDHYLWSFVDHKPIVNAWTSVEQVPASTPLSDKISKDLKKLGFKFVGSTTIYALMQSIGMVNDHITSCAFYHR